MIDELCRMILTDDWSEYDIRKARLHEDHTCPDLTKEWELNFYAKVISKHLPINVLEIKTTLLSTANHTPYLNKGEIINKTLQKLKVYFDLSRI